MLTLERLLYFLRDLSAMFSPWWSHSSDVQQVASGPEKLLQSKQKQKPASFRFSTSAAQADASDLESVKLPKKKSKHKRSKSKRHFAEGPDSIRESTKHNKSQLKDEPSSQGQVEDSGKEREPCRIINLKIPLPDDAADLLSRYYYHNPYKDYLQLKSDVAKPQEDASSRGAKRTRKKGVVVHRNIKPESQPTLKSVELVNFATEDQTVYVGDIYSQHQRTVRPMSSSVVTLHSSASKYCSIQMLKERCSTAATPSHHSQLCFTPITHPRQSYPSTESTEVTLKSQYSLYPTRRHMQNHNILRPVFKYSHRTGAPAGTTFPSPLTDCSCADGCLCRLCLSSIRMVHPTSLTLDGFIKHPTMNFIHTRRRSLDGSCRLGLALPPLKTALSQEEDSYRELHALGHSVTKYPPKAVERRNGKMSLASTSMRSTREPPVPTYPDALTNGPPGYHRRISQMAILVSETIRWEKDKPKTKSKKSSKGSQGSL